VPPIRKVGIKYEADAEQSEKNGNRRKAAEDRVHGNVEIAHTQQARYGERTERSDEKFEVRIDPYGVGATLCPAADVDAARREAGHKHGQHRGNGVGGVSEDEAKRLAPGHLVNQTRRAGQEETSEDREETLGW
jgi:hypothetical protein